MRACAVGLMVDGVRYYLFSYRLVAVGGANPRTRSCVRAYEVIELTARMSLIHFCDIPDGRFRGNPDVDHDITELPSLTTSGNVSGAMSRQAWGMLCPGPRGATPRRIARPSWSSRSPPYSCSSAAGHVKSSDLLCSYLLDTWIPQGCCNKPCRPLARGSALRLKIV